MKKSFLILAVSLLASIAIVVGLFMSSEAHINNENPFIRKLVPSSAEPLSVYPLGGAGYYIAGTDRTTIYLGNRSAPLYLLALNIISGETVRYKISLEKYDLPFRSVTIQVVPPYFFLYDGTVPVIFKGGLSDLKGYMIMDEKIYFTAAAALSDTSIAIRGFKGNRGENILGLLSAEGNPIVKFSEELLVKQLDGIFDTDGKLHYCRRSGTLVYLYFYRNEYIVTDSLLQLKSRGQTIDTVSTANLNIVTLPDSGDTKLAAPPKMVNRDFLIHGNLMFVNSLLRGRHESAKVWQQASAVDIYDLKTNTYLSSFYIYNEGRNTPKDFTVIGDVFYAIAGTSLQRYKLDKSIMDKMQK